MFSNSFKNQAYDIKSKDCKYRETWTMSLIGNNNIPAIELHTKAGLCSGSALVLIDWIRIQVGKNKEMICIANAGCFLMWARSFSCTLDVRHEGQGIIILQFTN
jgi:hypothetical protein